MFNMSKFRTYINTDVERSNGAIYSWPVYS